MASLLCLCRPAGHGVGSGASRAHRCRNSIPVLARRVTLIGQDALPAHGLQRTQPEHPVVSITGGTRKSSTNGVGARDCGRRAPAPSLDVVEPGGAGNLRKMPDLARAGRPLQRERVALNRSGVDLRFDTGIEASFDAEAICKPAQAYVAGPFRRRACASEASVEGPAATARFHSRSSGELVTFAERAQRPPARSSLHRSKRRELRHRWLLDARLPTRVPSARMGRLPLRPTRGADLQLPLQ